MGGGGLISYRADIDRQPGGGKSPARGRFCLFLLLFAVLLGGFRVHFLGYGKQDSAKLSGLKRSGCLIGFIYRSTWNSDGKVVFVNSDFKAVADISGLDEALVGRLESGSFVKITHYYIYEAEKPRNPGLFDYRRYLLSRGVTYCIKIFDDGIEETQIDASIAFPGILHLPGAFLRGRIRGILEGYLGEAQTDIVTAIMTGDTGNLDDDTKNDFRSSGISHLMAVSGMHVTFILIPFRTIVKNRKTGFKMRQILLILPLAAFLMIADFSSSVIRASAGAIFGYVSAILSRPNDRLNALCISAAIQLFINPYALFGAGFLMSYLAVAALIFIAPSVSEMFLSLRYKERKNVKKLSLINLNSLSAGISVNLMLLPLSVVLYGGFSPAGLVATIYASPMAAAICISGYVLFLLGTLDFLFIFRPAAWLLKYLLKAICSVVIYIAKLGSGLPPPFGYISVPAGARIAVALVCVPVLIILSPLRKKLLAALRRIMKRSKENRIFKRKMAVCCVLILCATVALTVDHFVEKPLIEALAVDVGQGSAMLIKADGYAGLIDTGDGKTDVAKVAEAQGIGRLDFIVLSHGHLDHAGGLEAVLEAYSEGVLYVSEDTGSGIIAACQKARDNGWDVVNVKSGDRIALGRVTMSFSVADEFFGGRTDADENNASVCVTFSCDYGSLTVAGDLQAEGEAALAASGALKNIDVLIVAHHGSASGSGTNFLSITSPEYAIISVGRSNSYGHPSPETLERLRLCGCGIYRTDTGGGISIVIGRPGLFRRKRIRIWQTL